MEQQQLDQLHQCATVQLSPLQLQPPKTGSAQLTAGDSAIPAAGDAAKSSSTPPHDTGPMQLPPVNTVPPV